MYFKGQGMAQDYKQALYWLTKAAKQGNYRAQGILGFIYFQGDGVPQNFKLSYVWLNLAAAKGNEEMIELRDSIAKSLSPQQLVEAQELAGKIQY